MVGPWALAGLAIVNLGRAAARSASVYLGPGLLAAGAAAALIRPRIDLPDVSDVLMAATIVGAAVLVITAMPEGQTWTRVLWSGRATAPPRPIGPMRAVAVLGEVRLDFLHA